MKSELDMIWTLMAGILVFFMQAGFMSLESGMVRSKNSINVAIKNFLDFTISSVTFWLFGFAIMFGHTFEGFFGIDRFFPEYDEANSWEFTFWFFQVVFAGTAATIASGAIAERVKFSGYLIMSFFISALIYPVFGHWAWGNLLFENQVTFLTEMGFVDFAGSTVVHAVGGWAGLAGAVVIGPRIGKYVNGKSMKISAYNLGHATMGTFILWLGWFGFNGGSLTAASPDIGKIIVNTNLAAATGGITALLVIWIIVKKPVIEYALNGVLGGLVAITANCDKVSAHDALVIGALAGILLNVSIYVIDNYLKVDDPVGAVSVHGVCGVWGTLAVAIFIPSEGGWLNQLYVQFIGSLTAFIWAFGVSYIIFWIINKTFGLRPTAEEEKKGLNFAEHGAVSTLTDTAVSMKEISRSQGDLTQRIEAELGDEMGEIGVSFNRLLDWLHDVVFLFRNFSDKIASTTDNLSKQVDKTETVINTMVGEMKGVFDEIRHEEEIIETSKNKLDKMISQMNGVSEKANNQRKQANISEEKIKMMVASINNVADMAKQADDISKKLLTVIAAGGEDIRAEIEAIKEIEKSSNQVAEILQIIENISNKTNLLAMNAAIEAAHAGEAGRGFAVVAGEIRKLAANTSSSAKSISDIINIMIAKIKNASEIAIKSESALNIIFKDINESAQINMKIAELTKGQLQSSDDILSSVHSLTSMAEEIEKLITDQQSESKQIEFTIGEVLRIASKLKEAVENQVDGGKDILDAIHEVNEATNDTQFMANELKEMISQFKLSEKPV